MHKLKIHSGIKYKCADNNIYVGLDNDVESDIFKEGTENRVKNGLHAGRSTLWA